MKDKTSYWEFIESHGSNSNGKSIAKYRCICGKEKILMVASVKALQTTTCGCGRRRHNLSKHALYMVWYDMNMRCYDEDCKSYSDYGGRGISVCTEWQKSVLSFHEWAIANGYEKGLKLDRKENDGNYSPENCRFVTIEVNNRNTRRNFYITYCGETKAASEWAVEMGIKSHTLIKRIKAGWPIETALIPPTKRTNNDIAIC
jgi:hypothetical protein